MRKGGVQERGSAAAVILLASLSPAWAANAGSAIFETIC
jgi:hypothetical protein